MTYDGTSVRLYVNGTLVPTTPLRPARSPPRRGALRIGGNSIWGEYFSGLIDEVRVYNRALSAAEIQQDMASSITPSDSQPPTAPGNLAANGSLSSAALSWRAASDNVGVARYNVYRSTSPGFTPSAANRIAQPSGTSYNDTGLAAGTYYYKVHRRGRRRQRRPGLERGERGRRRHDAALGAGHAERNRSNRQGNAQLGRRERQRRRRQVRRLPLDHPRLHAGCGATGSRSRPAPSYTDTVTPGTYYYKVTAEDAAGNIGPASNEASALVSADTSPPSAPPTWPPRSAAEPSI